MRFGGVLTASLMAAVLGASAALAEMQINGPAEVPPSSYTGRQYVDSAGCVFVRAGYGGTASWVPRVGRDKKQLCGYQPTFQKGERVLDVANSAPVTPAPAKPAAPPAKPAPAPVAAAPAKPAAPMVAAAPPATRPISPFTPTPGVGRPMATIALTTTPPQIGRAAPPAAPAPVKTAATVPVQAAPTATGGYVSPYVDPAYTGRARVAAAAPAAPAVRYHNTTALPAAPASAAPVSIVAAEAVPVASTSCPAGTASAQRYQLSDGRRVVRCGPQTANPAAFINNASVPGLVVAPAATAGDYVSPYVNPTYSGAVSAPLVGGNGYGASAYATPAYAPAAVSAPMVGGTGYGASAQQGYAAASPYQSAPAAVIVRSRTGQTTLAPVIVATKTGPTGYREAFQDGRLNPYRGPRSAVGDLEQARLWDDKVPARLIATTAAQQPVVLLAPAPVARISSKSVAVPVPAPQPQRLAQPQATAARFIQVGTFGVAGNAEAAKARLRAAGLPVATSTLTRGGKVLTVVLAGPFADARAALGTARAAGFGDAILR